MVVVLIFDRTVLGGLWGEAWESTWSWNKDRSDPKVQ